MDAETRELCDMLISSVKQMKAGEAARKTVVPVPDVVRARHLLRMSQSDFANIMGVSVRTLQSWEQGRRQPSGAAKTLIKVANKHPEVLLDMVL